MRTFLGTEFRNLARASLRAVASNRGTPANVGLVESFAPGFPAAILILERGVHAASTFVSADRLELFNSHWNCGSRSDLKVALLVKMRMLRTLCARCALEPEWPVLGRRNVRCSNGLGLARASGNYAVVFAVEGRTAKVGQRFQPVPNRPDATHYLAATKTRADQLRLPRCTGFRDRLEALSYCIVTAWFEGSSLFSVDPLGLAEAVTVAVGFSPRQAVPRKPVAERQLKEAIDVQKASSVASRRQIFPAPVRGLKPTATLSRRFATGWEAISGYIASLKKHNEPVPPPITEEVVEVPA